MGVPQADLGTLLTVYLKVPEFPHPCMGEFFLFLLKLSIESLCQIARGRLFQNLGTATANARSPEVLHHAGVRNLVKTRPGRHCVESSVPGS